ncbi:MAG: nucleotidyltransferase [Candidatus Firestonebacteria bacterium]|mgnify:CR=1 FL=1
MGIEKLLKLLKENKVKFVIIGATAFPVYGYARATLDTDIFIKPEKQNASSVLKALKEFGYDVTDVTVEDLISKKLLIRQYTVETDVHPFVKGVTFEEAWEHKVKAKIGKTEVFFASLDDLIKMKKSANRPKDKEDLKYLAKIKKTIK